MLPENMTFDSSVAKTTNSEVTGGNDASKWVPSCGVWPTFVVVTFPGIALAINVGCVPQAVASVGCCCIDIYL